MRSARVGRFTRRARIRQDFAIGDAEYEAPVNVAESDFDRGCDVLGVYEVDAFGFFSVAVGVAADEAAYEAPLFARAGHPGNDLSIDFSEIVSHHIYHFLIKK